VLLSPEVVTAKWPPGVALCDPDQPITPSTTPRLSEEVTSVSVGGPAGPSPRISARRWRRCVARDELAAGSVVTPADPPLQRRIWEVLPAGVPEGAPARQVPGRVPPGRGSADG